MSKPFAELNQSFIDDVIKELSQLSPIDHMKFFEQIRQWSVERLNGDHNAMQAQLKEMGEFIKVRLS
mgnify:FL=1